MIGVFFFRGGRGEDQRQTATQRSGQGGRPEADSETRGAGREHRRRRGRRQGQRRRSTTAAGKKDSEIIGVSARCVHQLTKRGHPPPLCLQTTPAVAPSTLMSLKPKRSWRMVSQSTAFRTCVRKHRLSRVLSLPSFVYEDQPISLRSVCPLSSRRRCLYVAACLLTSDTVGEAWRGILREGLNVPVSPTDTRAEAEKTLPFVAGSSCIVRCGLVPRTHC